MGNFQRFAVAIAPEIGVPGVPDVPPPGTPCVSAVSRGIYPGTPSLKQGVPGVPNISDGTQRGTPSEKGVPGKTLNCVPTNTNENMVLIHIGTPQTPGTSIFNTPRERLGSGAVLHSEPYRFIDPAIDRRGWIEATIEKAEVGARAYARWLETAKNRKGAP